MENKICLEVMKKNIIRFPNPNVPKAKITDEELINLWKMGYSDIYIAKQFNCHSVSIRSKRCRLGLIANFKPFVGENCSKEELLKSHKDKLRRYTIRNNNNPKRYKQTARYSQHRVCLDCGIIVSNEGIRCHSCSNKYKGNHKEHHQTREEFLNYQKEYNKNRRHGIPPKPKVLGILPNFI